MFVWWWWWWWHYYTLTISTTIKAVVFGGFSDNIYWFSYSFTHKSHTMPNAMATAVCLSHCRSSITYCWTLRRQHHAGRQPAVEARSSCSHLDHTLQQCWCSSRHHNHQRQQYAHLTVHTQRPVNDQRSGRRLDASSQYLCCSIHTMTVHCSHSSLQLRIDLLQTQLPLTTNDAKAMWLPQTTGINLTQVDQLSQRDRATGWVSYGQKWKTGTGRQYLRIL